MSTREVDSLDAVFAPVVSQTAFEETVERLGTAIKLGLLKPGERLPPERDLCAKLGIARSTLRQALTALGQSGHLRAVRGRGGGTFVADELPPHAAPADDLVANWRDACDMRLATELGVATLACDRADADTLDRLDDLVRGMQDLIDDFEAYRQCDVKFHIALAEATGSPRLVTAMTEAQSQMTDLILHIAHPPEVLDWANAQHARLVSAMREGDRVRAVSVMTEHLHGLEHILAGLLPAS